MAALPDLLPTLCELAGFDVASRAPESLDVDIRRSQARRRLVGASHEHGPGPVWEHQPGDPDTPWLLRGKGLYNDRAWQGIRD